MIDWEPTLGDLVNELKDAPPKTLAKIIAFARRTINPELEGLPDWLVNAPPDDEPLTDEDKAALLEAEEAIKSGDVHPGEETFRQLLG